MAHKHKNVFLDAVSEMKHFLLGAALVLVLVTVVPALAQEGPGAPPPGGNPPPPMNQGGNMPPPPQGGQLQGGQQFGGQPQGGQQQFGGQQQGGQQFGGQQQGGQQQFGQQMNGQMGGQNNGQMGQQNGQFGQPANGQFGQSNNGMNGQQNGKFGQEMKGKMDGQQGGQNNGQFKCQSDPSAKTAVECAIADEKAGFKKGDMRNAPANGTNNGPAVDPATNNGQEKNQDKGPASSMKATPPSKFDFSTVPTPINSFKKEEPSIQFDFGDLGSEDDSDVGQTVFEQALKALEGTKLKGKAAAAAADRIMTTFNKQVDSICLAIEDEDDSDTCYEIFETYSKKFIAPTDAKELKKFKPVKTTAELVKALKKFQTKYYNLAGIELPDEE